MRKLRVFVSSALDELEYEREIARRVITHLRLDPILFEGLPAMNKYLDDAYLDEVRNCDLFVLILWKQLRPPVEREYNEAVKSGKPVLVFLKMLRQSERMEKGLLRFLGGFKNGSDTSPTSLVRFYRHYRSLLEFEEGLGEGLVGEMTTMLAREPITTHTRQELYELGTSIIKQARKRLFMSQLTPSVFFGSRPYEGDEDRKIPYEAEFLRSCRDWIDLTVRDDKREMIYLYDGESTRVEMEKFNRQDAVREAIRELKEKERASGHRFRITSVQSRWSGPLGVGDNWFAIWLMGVHAAVCLSYVNEKIADVLSDLFKEVASEIRDEQSLLIELGLNP